MVSLDPESTSRQTNREVLSELIKVHRKTSRGGKLPAYDGGKNQCNVSSLPFQSKEFSVALVGTEKEDKEWTERAYNITIRIAGRTDLYHLHFVENKINLKAGGRNIVPAADVTHPPPVSEVPVIIFGADVTPPQPGEDSASIAGVVALMDWTEITKKRGLVSAQSHRQEIIEDLFNVTKDPQRGTFNGGMSRKLFIVQKRHHTKLFPEVQETSAENCLTADARLPSNFSGPAISNVLPVHSLESDNLKPDVGQDKPPDKINKIQALVKVLSFETFPLMVERHWSVQNVVSHAFLKLGVCFDPRVSFNHKEASLDQRISDLVNEECSVYIQARLLGGVHTYLRKIPLLKYITSIGSRLFDVVTLDPKLHYPDMVPYFIGLTPEPTSIILFLINLLHKKFHMRLKCPGRFTVESLLYKTPKKKVSFIPEVGEVDFSAEAYLYNMNDLGSVIFDLFRYDENLLLANSDNIHASGNKPLPSWKLPMLLELLVHDLKEGLAKFSHRLDVRENKKYLDTHLGLLSGPARTAYILTSELNVGYIHGENNLEKVVGLLRAQFVNQAAANQPPPVPEGQAAADQPPPVPQDQSAVDQLPPVPQDQSATDQHPPPPVPQNDAAADQPAPVLQNQDQAVPLSKLSRKRKRRQQNRLAAGNSQPQPPTAQPQAPPRKRKNRRAKKHVAIPKWNIKVERSYYLSKLLEGGRKYDFERIGAKWSYSRNWLSHAPSYVGWITLKQAEAYLQLTLAGLLYNIRLRTRFPEAKVDWGSSPRPVEKHPGADTTHINQAWCTNDFTEEEILQIG